MGRSSMTIKARLALTQDFSGDRPGVTFYSIQPAGTWTGGDLDASVFENVIKGGKTYLMAGQLQDVNAWDITFAEFPSSDSWRRSVELVFDWIFRSGGVVAWIADGIGYTGPPDLFVPEKTAEVILEGRSVDGLQVGLLDLDEPLIPLNKAQLEQLRLAAQGLADTEWVDVS
jgi:hypothetical protein